MIKSKDEYKSVVNHPGKFQGESSHTPYFHDVIMSGDGDLVDYDDSGWSITVIQIDDDDCEMWPNLIPYQYAIIETSAQGFVSCMLCKDWDCVSDFCQLED